MLEKDLAHIKAHRARLFINQHLGYPRDDITFMVAIGLCWGMNWRMLQLTKRVLKVSLNQTGQGNHYTIATVPLDTKANTANHSSHKSIVIKGHSIARADIGMAHLRNLLGEL